MYEQIQIIAFTFAALFPVLNPLSGAMIFLNLTHGLPDSVLAKLAKQVGINTFVLLIIVLLSGSWILGFFGITIPIVQNDKAISEMAFFPLTMPLTAGPGCIAVTLTIGAHEMSHNLIETIVNQFAAAIGILLAAITVWICYRYADAITQKIGESGKRVIMRLAAFINLCIGLQIVWNGVQGILTKVL